MFLNKGLSSRSLQFQVVCPPCAVTFSWWAIAYLTDPDSYAGWSCYTPVRATQARQVEG